MNPDSWKRVEADARWRLEHPDQSPPMEPIQGMALQLRLWQYPHFGVQASWSLILPVRDYRTRKSLLRETAWDRPADWKHSRSLSKSPKLRPKALPSIRIRDAEMEWADLATFLDETGGLPMEALGKDRTISSGKGVCGVEGYRSLAHIRLEWAGKGPRGWKITIARVERFRRVLERVLRDRGIIARAE
jgi:hypothetical protein